MRIGELAKRTGLAPSAIRYYERCDMFSPGQITRHHNGYRDYSPAAQRRVQLITAGRAVGFTLTQMREQMADWETMNDTQREKLLTDRLHAIDAKLADLARGREAVLAVLAKLHARRAEAGGEAT